MSASFASALILFLVAFAAVPMSRRWTGDYFSPPALIVTTWAATFGVFLLQVIPYPEIARETIWLLLASSVAIVVAAVVSWRRIERSPGTFGRLNLLHPDWCIRTLAIGGLLGIAWYLWSVADTLGLSAFVDRPQRIRFGMAEGLVPTRFLVFEYLCIATPIAAVTLSLTGTPLRRSTWALVALATLGTWISTDRTQFFVVALTVYFVFVLAKGRSLRLVPFVVSTLVFLVVLGSYFLLIGAWMSKTPATLGVEIQLPRASRPALQMRAQSGQAPKRRVAQDESSWEEQVRRNLQRVSTIFLYATASYRALDVLLDNPQPRTYGAHVLYPLARLFERVGIVPGGVPQAIPPFAPLGLTEGTDVTFNAYTYLYYPLVDFGPVGAVLYAGAIGALVGAIYGCFRRERASPFWVLTMGHVSMALALTVFVNKFNNTAAWYIYAWSCLPFAVALVAKRLGWGAGADPRAQAS